MIAKKWQNRAAVIGVSLLLFAIAISIVLKVFNDNIVFFYSPTDLVKKEIKPSGRDMRVGGLVKDGSVKYLDDKTTLEFQITDIDNDLTIRYKGIIPNLFREGQGTVALGKLTENGIFQARELLAKHDENYMPKEVADSIKKSGQWKPNKR